MSGVKLSMTDAVRSKNRREVRKVDKLRNVLLKIFFRVLNNKGLLAQFVEAKQSKALTRRLGELHSRISQAAAAGGADSASKDGVVKAGGEYAQEVSALPLDDGEASDVGDVDVMAAILQASDFGNATTSTKADLQRGFGLGFENFWSRNSTLFDSFSASGENVLEEEQQQTLYEVFARTIWRECSALDTLMFPMLTRNGESGAGEIDVAADLLAERAEYLVNMVFIIADVVPNEFLHVADLGAEKEIKGKDKNTADENKTDTQGQEKNVGRFASRPFSVRRVPQFIHNFHQFAGAAGPELAGHVLTSLTLLGVPANDQLKKLLYTLVRSHPSPHVSKETARAA